MSGQMNDSTEEAVRYGDPSLSVFYAAAPAVLSTQ